LWQKLIKLDQVFQTFHHIRLKSLNKTFLVTIYWLFRRW